MKKIVSILKNTVLFAAVLFALLPCMHPKAEENEARLLTVTRGVYNDAIDLAPGPWNDGVNFARVISAAYGDRLVVTSNIGESSNTTVKDVREKIQQTFADSEAGDYNYFYYSGHGVLEGIYLSSGEILTARALADAFSGIEGTNVIVLDCCYSGGMIARAAFSNVNDFSGRFTQEFAQAVTTGKKARSALTRQQFRVITSASEEEASWQINYGENFDVMMGSFTATMCYGCGVDPIMVQSESGYELKTCNADYDFNGSITFDEIEKFIYNTNYYDRSNLCTYPAGCEEEFIPVPDNKEPFISCSDGVIETGSLDDSSVISIPVNARKPMVADYAVYHTNTALLGILSTTKMYGRTALPNYSDVTRMCIFTNKVIQPGKSSIEIPIADYDAGNYYVIIQFAGQEIRYFIPFAVEDEAAQKAEFSIKCTGDHFKDNIFGACDDAELTIKADLGSTTDSEKIMPYLRCDVYDEYGSLVKTISEGSAAKLIKVGGSYQCYKNFYWDGSDTAGNVVDEGLYFIRISNSAGKAEEIEVTVEHNSTPVNYDLPEIRDFIVSNASVSLPATDGSNLPEISFSVSDPGKILVNIMDASMKNVVKALALEEVTDVTKTYHFTWDCKCTGGKAASMGEYFVTVFYLSETGDTQSTSSLISVSAEPLKCDVKNNNDSWLVYCSGGSATLLYDLNYSTYSVVTVKDENGREVQKLKMPKYDSAGTNYAIWDGKDVTGNFVSPGIYSFSLSVQDPFSLKQIDIPVNSKIIVSEKNSCVDKIQLQRPVIKVRKTKKKIQISWKRIKDADSIVVYRKKGNGKWEAIKTLSGQKKSVKLPAKKYKKGTHYKIRIRAFATVNGKKICSPYSKVRKIS